MNVYLPVVLIAAAIVIVLLWRAISLMRRENGAQPRGTSPGRGYTEIDSSYYSGGGGGGHQSSFRVPKDPQEYAKGFVPRQKDTSNER